MRILEHPDITRTLQTGYPFMETEDLNQDAYDAYCDRCYEEQKEAMLFGED